MSGRRRKNIKGKDSKECFQISVKELLHPLWSKIDWQNNKEI